MITTVEQLTGRITLGLVAYVKQEAQIDGLTQYGECGPDDVQELDDITDAIIRLFLALPEDISPIYLPILEEVGIIIDTTLEELFAL